jgi:hypothetical protein
MKKVLLFISLFYAHIEAISPGRANQLRSEFNQIGIYKPSNPNNYNEQRANEILNELNTGGFSGMGKRLRIQQLESLRLRPAAPQPSKTAPPTKAAPVQPSINPLQQQNEQLQNQIQQLQQQNNQLRQQIASASVVSPLQQQNELLQNQILQLQQQNNQLRQQVAAASETQPASNEIIRLALQVIDATNNLNSNIGQAQVHLGLNDIAQASTTIDNMGIQFDQLETIREQLEQLIQK